MQFCYLMFIALVIAPDRNSYCQTFGFIREKTLLMIIQGDQLNMALCFWYLVKTSPVYWSVHWKSHFLQGTIKTRLCLSGQAEYRYKKIHFFSLHICNNFTKTLYCAFLSILIYISVYLSNINLCLSLSVSLL